MSIRIKAVGDLCGSSKKGEDPFVSVNAQLQDCDLLIGNLETCLTSKRQPEEKKAYTLVEDPAAAARCSAAGFDVLGVANNHILDYGIGGAIDTLAALESVGVQSVGAGVDLESALAAYSTIIQGRRIGVISFYAAEPSSWSPGFVVASGDIQLVLHRIRELSSSHDFVLVSLHWGTENTHYPSPSQQQMARACIDHGACVILGHHPHRVHGIEKYGAGVIYYSLGNFNFMPCGVGLSGFHNFSMIADIMLDDDGSVCANYVPITINDDYVPVPEQDPVVCDAYAAHIEAISRPLHDTLNPVWWYGRIARPYLLGNIAAFGRSIRLHGLRHAGALALWLISPFNLKVYAGLIARFFRRICRR